MRHGKLPFNFPASSKGKMGKGKSKNFKNGQASMYVLVYYHHYIITLAVSMHRIILPRLILDVMSQPHCRQLRTISVQDCSADSSTSAKSKSFLSKLGIVYFVSEVGHKLLQPFRLIPRIVF